MSKVLAGALVTAMGLAAGTVGLGSAVADPADGPPPPPPPQTVLGQATSALAQTDPLLALTNLMAASPQPPAVGASPVPPAGTDVAGPAPDPLALAMGLLPQNYRMPADGQNSPYQLAPNSTPSPFARIDAWKGVHALAHGALGRMPGDELGQPLPGTAAAPGSNLPAGLEQFYVDPSAPPADPAAPPA